MHARTPSRIQPIGHSTAFPAHAGAANHVAPGEWPHASTKSECHRTRRPAEPAATVDDPWNGGIVCNLGFVAWRRWCRRRGRWALLFRGFIGGAVSAGAIRGAMHCVHTTRYRCDADRRSGPPPPNGLGRDPEVSPASDNQVCRDVSEGGSHAGVETEKGRVAILMGGAMAWFARL